MDIYSFKYWELHNNQKVVKNKSFNEYEILEINKKSLPCWILTTPRTGSTWLCYMLNATKLFGSKDFHPMDGICPNTWSEHANPLWFNKNDYIVSKDYMYKFPPPVNKIHKHQFDSIFDDSNIVEKWFPNIKFILLKRKNSIEQTISFYLGYYNGMFNNKSNELKNVKTPFIEDIVLKIYQKILEYDSIWNGFLKNKNYITIYYEDICEDNLMEVNKIINFIGLEKVNKIDSVPIFKNNINVYDNYVDRLKEILNVVR